MRASVIRMWNNGKQVPRWQWGQLVPQEGELRIQDSLDQFMRRYLRSAHLFDLSQTGGDVIPPLIDVAVISIVENRIVMTGFERVESLDSSATVAQTWIASVLEPKA